MNKFLAIDDSKVALMQAKKYFTKLFPDCEVLTSPNPEDGVQLIKEHKDSLDLILLDFNMKEMTGLDVIEAVTGDIDLSKIIVCTANLQTILKNKVIEKGAYFIEKPLSEQKLNEAITNQQKKAS